MQIVLTNLAIRFYMNDGWTNEKLLSIVEKPHFNKEGLCFTFFPDEYAPYWVPNVGTKLDMDKLIGMVTKVYRCFPQDFPNLSDAKLIRRYQW